MRYIALYFALCFALIAQTTKVGGTGTTKVGGTGTTKVGAGAGTPTYYYSGTGTYSGSSSYDASFYTGGPVTCGQAGIITRIGTQGTYITSGNVKIALYDNSGTLLASGGSVAVTGALGTTWIEITGLSVAVTNGQVVQVWISPDSVVGSELEDSSGNLLYQAGVYASFPGGTVSASTVGARLLAVRVYVQ
jgi:hypothetical protein